jgi:hypothetical protein
MFLINNKNIFTIQVFDIVLLLKGQVLIFIKLKEYSRMSSTFLGLKQVLIKTPAKIYSFLLC